MHIQIRKIAVIVFVLFQAQFLSAQDSEISPEVEKDSFSIYEITDNMNVFLNNSIIFAVSLDEGGFGFGGTITAEYKTPFKFSFGLETGYYGIKSESNLDGFYVIGGFSLIPFYAIAAYDFEIIDDFYIAPVLKFGVAYTNARINGWFGGDSASMVFEAGVRTKAFLGGGLLVQANLFYSAIIEKSGLFSMINLGLGIGF